MKKAINGPKVLIMDLETSYLEGPFWDIWEQNIPIQHLDVKEWSIIAFSAKWLGSKEIIYHDNRKKKNKRDDKDLVLKLQQLLNEADVVITKNGKRFDEKMFNARCAKHRIHPPGAYRHLDIEKVVRKRFKLVSYSLEYLCMFFDTKHKKLKHGQFPGMVLWKECLKGNLKAWKEMEHYNKYDVLSTEDVYEAVKAWDNTVDFNLYRPENSEIACNCGSHNLHSRGYNYSKSGKFKRYQCRDCGSWFQGKKNLVSKDRREILKKKV